MNEIKKTTLHPDNQPNTDLYPKTSTDQVEGLNNIITGINNEIEKKVNTVDNFVRIFTIPNGVSSGTLTADVKEKLCNPDGHNYYVYDDTSEMILKYSFNSENEIIQYKAMYLQTNKAYEITMQILPSNGSWRRSQTVLNVPASAGGKLYLHFYSKNIETSGDPKNTVNSVDIVFYSSSSTKLTGSEYYNTIYVKNRMARVNCTISGGYANYTVEQTMYMNLDESKGDYTIQVNEIFNPANTTLALYIPTLYYKDFTSNIIEV